MTRISDLSQDLIEEILSRVPLTSQRAARSTCKQWNGLYKEESFTKKHCSKAANDDMVIMVCDSRVCLMSIDLEGVHNHKDGFVELSTKLIGKLNHIMVSNVYRCDGLLLCLPKNNRPVLWNPYLGQVRRIKHWTKRFIRFNRYCIGYDNNHNHKISRFLHHGDVITEYEIYDLKSDSWRVRDVFCDWIIPCYREGLSLKGNTYFVSNGRLRVRDSLICFDFTSERFRHCFDLGSISLSGDSVMLSSVREEQLAMFFYRHVTYEIEIWITTKVEANEMSWRSFLKVNMDPFTERSWMFFPPCGSFLVDEKKKVALIWDDDNCNLDRAYVIGEDNYFKIVAPGESQCWRLVSSYVPSSVQIQKVPVHARGKRKVWEC